MWKFTVNKIQKSYSHKGMKHTLLICCRQKKNQYWDILNFPHLINIKNVVKTCYLITQLHACSQVEMKGRKPKSTNQMNSYSACRYSKTISIYFKFFFIVVQQFFQNVSWFKTRNITVLLHAMLEVDCQLSHITLNWTDKKSLYSCKCPRPSLTKFSTVVNFKQVHQSP